MEVPTTPETQQKSVLEILAQVAVHQASAQQKQEAFHNALRDFDSVAVELKDKEVLMSGRLEGRGGTVVWSDDPRSEVADMPVRITGVRVNSGESYHPPRAPYIDLMGRTLDDADELITANLRPAGVHITPLPETQG